ncbi:hypothetical protein ONZ43_g5153 [Nemania bipapillata]|uniref:Uncharacterized protein n=1 Tax=Nemania bipapillata TaxID=110536 RepID=A0ACC2IE15_9PEZI|nr:hypothetical protein ONZ43_g5153 [Nemania bipapillata]
MALTVSWDRPIAIRGLETRLMQTFDDICVYGILGQYLHRFLLWKKDGDSMKAILQPLGKEIPSWSWMAYEGAIKYIDPLGSTVQWMSDLRWPLSEPTAEHIGHHGLNWWSKIDYRSLVEIEAPIWDLLELPVKGVMLDDNAPFDAPHFKCVIVGISKRPTGINRQYYVLIVQRFLVDNVEVWKRRGVAVMEPRYIDLDGPRMVVRLK